MTEQFINNGYEITDFDNKADIYIINTCTVTNMSDRKSRQIIRRTKEKNNKAIVVATRMLCTSCKARIRKNRRNRYNNWKHRKKRNCKYSRRIL